MVKKKILNQNRLRLNVGITSSLELGCPRIYFYLFFNPVLQSLRLKYLIINLYSTITNESLEKLQIVRTFSLSHCLSMSGHPGLRYIAWKLKRNHLSLIMYDCKHTVSHY